MSYLRLLGGVLFFLIQFKAHAMVSPQIQPIAFELAMIEHQLGVQSTGLFLLEKQDVVLPLHLQILTSHLAFVSFLLSEHDAAKVRQNSSFLKRYNLSSSEPSLSVLLSRFYGIDLHESQLWPEGMTLEDREGAIGIIKKVNEIDQNWIASNIERYAEQNNLSARWVKNFTNAYLRLELASDLLNRKMLEEILYERFWLTYKNNIKYLFEFGHPFELDSLLDRHWKGFEGVKQIALKYVNSKELKKRITQAGNHRNVTRRYYELTKKSPYYTQNSARLKFRKYEILAYIEHRKEVDQILAKESKQSVRGRNKSVGVAAKKSDEEYLNSFSARKNENSVNFKIKSTPSQCSSLFGI